MQTSTTRAPAPSGERGTLKSCASDRTTRSAYAHLFLNRTDTYLAAVGSRWTRVRRDLAEPLLDAAIAGNAPLGIYANDPAGLSRWCCIDVDSDEQQLTLQVLAATLDSRNTLLETSR